MRYIRDNEEGGTGGEQTQLKLIRMTRQRKSNEFKRLETKDYQNKTGRQTAKQNKPDTGENWKTEEKQGEQKMKPQKGTN